MKNVVFILLFLPFAALSQKTHTVAAKETLYSISRQYNVHPRELAAFNNIPVTTGLTIGQIIRIPSNATMPPLEVPSKPADNVSVKEEPPVDKKNPAIAPDDAKGQKLIHKVKKKENLYQISRQYPGSTVADIRKWNRLSSDNLSEGQDLIVGYTSVQSNRPVAETTTPASSAPPPPLTTNTSKTVEANVKEYPREAPPSPSPPVVSNPLPTETRTAKSFDGGFFRNQFSKDASSSESGVAGIFKSTSGWEDGKYYCLHNKARPGSIMKITNNANQRSVYAKVLDIMPNLRQNEGVLLRLSNAAASELGAGSDSFQVSISY